MSGLTQDRCHRLWWPPVRRTEYEFRTSSSDLGRVLGLTAHSRYPHATPAPRLVAERLVRQVGYDVRSLGRDLSLGAVELFGHQIPAFAAAALGPRGLRFVLNVATALLVLSLPYSVAGGLGAKSAPEPAPVAASLSSVSDDGGARVPTPPRGLVAGSRSIVTIAGEDVRPVVQYTVAKNDNLGSIAKSQQV